jgi:hypothetical protein
MAGLNGSAKVLRIENVTSGPATTPRTGTRTSA